MILADFFTPAMLQIVQYPLVYEPLSLMADVGLPRRGKTAFAVFKAIQAYLRGSQLYSNVIIHDEFGNDIRAEDGKLDPEEPGELLSQLQDLFIDIRENESWDQSRFMVLDEFSSIADAQDWKKYSWTSGIWKQLGKLGITAVAVDQNFSRIYNGYRDLVTFKYVIGDVDVNGSNVQKPWCSVIVGRQSANDHTLYGKVSDFYCDISLVYKFFDTHQLFYFGKNSKRRSR